MACFDSFAEEQRRRVEEACARIAEIDNHSTTRMQDWILAHGFNRSFDEYLAEAHASRGRAVTELRSADPLGMGGPSFFAAEMSRQLGGAAFHEVQARIEFDALRFKAQMRTVADFSNKYHNQLAAVAGWSNEYGALAATAAKLPAWPSLQADASAILDRLKADTLALPSMDQAINALLGREAIKGASIAALGLGSYGPAILRLPRVSGRDDAEDAGERRAQAVRQAIQDVESTPVRDEPPDASLRRRVEWSAVQMEVRKCGHLGPVLALKGKGNLTEDELWRVLSQADAMLRQLDSSAPGVAPRPDSELALGRAGDAGKRHPRDRAAAARAARAMKLRGYLARIAADERKGVAIMGRDYAAKLAAELCLTASYVRDLRTQHLKGKTPNPGKDKDEESEATVMSQ